MEGKPWVSVIIPVYNRAKLVKRTLDSISSQTYRPIEIIAVDNGSSDKTESVLKEWAAQYKDDPSFKIIITEEPQRGACNARNKGLDLAAGDYIQFFDSDDTMRPSLIEDAIDAFKKNDTAEIICWKCRMHLLDGSVRESVKLGSKPLEDHLIHALLKTQGYMAKKSLIDRVGKWNIELKGWNDWEYGLRLLLLDPVIEKVDKVLVDIYSQKESITGSSFSAREGVWEKSLEACRLAAEKSNHTDKARILDMITYRQVILAAHYEREGNREGADRLLSKSLEQVSPLKKKMLKMVYKYTLKGGRGAWKLIRHIY